MMSISANIKRLRLEAGFTQEQLAERLGVTRSTVTQWETGWSQPRMGMAAKLAGVFRIPLTALVAETDGSGRPDGAWAPLVGWVHAGRPADEEVCERMVPLPATVHDRHPAGFFLRVEGDCMSRAFPEGCLVFVDPEREPSENSAIAAEVDGYRAVLRRYHKGVTSLMLSPDSYSEGHRDILINDEDATVRLIGTVVWFQAEVELE